MRFCPKCKKQYENGNFCEDCENEDGSPVRLEEEKIKCPRCGRLYDVGKKFCLECGTRLGAAPVSANGGISIGDKNVIAGDVVGKKETYNVTGNATIIHTEDETKKTEKCHICGSVILKIQGYDCPSCGLFTCEDCFDKDQGICKTCVDKNIVNKEQLYKTRVIEFLSNDNIIDAGEFAQLTALAQELGISSFRAMQLQNEVKTNSSDTQTLTTFEKLNFEKALELFYEEGDSKTALSLLTPIYESHKYNEDILDLYLPVLADEDPAKAKEIIKTINFDCLAAYLTSTLIAMREGDLSTAEKQLMSALSKWKDNTIVKCYKVLFGLALYNKFKLDEWIKKAEALIPGLGNPKNKLELSWQVKVQTMVNEAKDNTSIEMDQDFCKQNQLYYGFMQMNPLLTKAENLKTIEELKRKKEKLEEEKREQQRREQERIQNLKQLEQNIIEQYYNYEIEDLIQVEKEFHNPQIQFLLCEKYRNKSDFENSLKFALKSAEQKYPDGIARLGSIYIMGNGVEKDTEKGLQLVEESINLESAHGYNFYGYLYDKGICKVQDLSKAFEWYQKAADKGNRIAQCNLGRFYRFGNLGEKDYNKAVELYKKSAEQGYAPAQLSLGYMYDMGEGVVQDYKRAFDLYSKAAKQGYAAAQYNLGDMYYSGRGVEQNFNVAFTWYKKSADQGHVSASYQTGRMYYDGQGTPQDYNKAFEYQQMAAEQGDAQAQCFLGYLYNCGQGTGTDLVKAVEWYTKSANQGYTVAQTNLAYMYSSGEGVTQDYSKAFEWYTKAADQGNSRAQCNLGEMYEAGNGVAQDYNQAIKWYQLAVKNYNKEAKQKLNDLQGKIEENQSSSVSQCMVYVAGGHTTLGSDDSDCENPKHDVKLDDFYISNLPVTQELYESVTGNNPSNFKGKKKPVENINWYEAVEFCNLLSIKEGLNPYYNIDKYHKDMKNLNENDSNQWSVSFNIKANGYRLPTDAEWEYAARGGNKSQKYTYAGSNNVDEVAWNIENSGEITHVVGLKKPNELGLYDMSGNVWEWCWDWMDLSHEIYDGKNPTGAESGLRRILHGGSFFCGEKGQKVSYRADNEPIGHNDLITAMRFEEGGIRLVRTRLK